MGRPSRKHLENRTHTTCTFCGTDEHHLIDDGFIYCETHGAVPVTPTAALALARSYLNPNIQ